MCQTAYDDSMTWRQGFTVVELLITISIISILLSLSVVSLHNSQVNARDSERKADVENIAKHMETYYTSGTDTLASPYKYPATSQIADEASIRGTLRDIDELSLRAPNTGDTTISLISATSNSTTMPISGSSTRPTIDEYVYQPLQASGALCTSFLFQECRKFNLYYRLEADNSVQVIESQHR